MAIGEVGGVHGEFAGSAPQTRTGSARLPVWNPEQDGAMCAICPLGPGSSLLDRSKSPWIPVPSEINPESDTFVLAQSPAHEEEKELRPLVGAAGREAGQAFFRAGLRRGDLSYGNVLSCFPGGSDEPASGAYERFQSKIRSYNRREARRAQSEGREPKLLPAPADCCQPRLLKDLSRFPNLILFGSQALQAVVGERASIAGLRGAPMEEPVEQPDGTQVSRKILATWHPSFVLQARRWRDIFFGDVAKALRFFRGGLNWKDPSSTYVPSPARLRDFIWSKPRSWLVYDVETAPTYEYPGIESFDETGLSKEEIEERSKDRKDFVLDPLRAKLRLVALGTVDEVMIVPFLSVDGETTFYDPASEVEIRDILKRFLLDPAITKVGWNQSSYDRGVIQTHFGITPAPICDGLLLHRLENSEINHGLGFVASIKLDVRAWKEGDIATEAKTDEELWEYSGLDVAVTASIVPDIAAKVEARGQAHLIPIDHAMAEICCGMHEGGIRVDPVARNAWAKKLRDGESKWTHESRSLSGRSDLNPHSHLQLVNLVYDDWSLPIKAVSEKTGEPSLDDNVLIQLLIDPLVSPVQRSFLKALRLVRKHRKLYSTYVLAAMPAPVGLVARDGRLHPVWKAYGTLSGRFSSAAINAQNQPNQLRNLYVPAPGRAFVGADADQLELRIATAVSRCQFYLDAFQNGWDPHGMLAEWAWADRYRKAQGYADPRVGKKPEKGTVAVRMRDFAKRLGYARLYSAALETVHEQVVSVEDDEFNLMFVDFTRRETRLVYDKWEEVAPEFPRWWEACEEEHRRTGKIVEPLGGRRRDCLDGTDRAELTNFAAQSSGSFHVNTCAQEIVAEFPFGRWGSGTGMVAQVHDSFLLEVPESAAEQVARRVSEIMTRRYDALFGMVLSAEAHVGKNWSEV